MITNALRILMMFYLVQISQSNAVNEELIEALLEQRAQVKTFFQLI